MAPRISHNVVDRPRLQKHLSSGLHAKLILVSAPAGSGKSTLLSTWLRQLERPTAWLSLDEGDNELERFLVYVISALQQVEPGLGAGLVEGLRTQSPVEVESLIIRLINDISTLGQELLLVLDDYHVITNSRIHHSIEFLLEHLPPGLYLVIATRSDPPLSLARLRVRRQLIEVRAQDLRFSNQEATTFLNERLGLMLSAQAIHSLEERTEGWAAGLQLAALSLGGRRDKEQFVQEFAGSHHYLVDYLIDEVLGRQTPEVRQFLERTSILDRFTAALCETVSGQTGAQNLLRQLHQANLFLTPLDDERKWYRYHNLFAEFLRHRLTEAEPEILSQLHTRASEWLEQEGWNDEAIHHALLAGDLVRAGRLVQAIAFSLQNTSNNVQLVRYVSRFPLELLATFPRLGIFFGWALVNTGQVALLSAAVPVIERSAVHEQQPEVVHSSVLQFRAYQCLWQMDFQAVVELCEQALELQQDHPNNDTERWLYTAAHNVIAYSYFFSDLAQSDKVYPAATALSQRLGNFIGAANDFARHGWVKHLRGDSREAYKLYQEGLEALGTWKVENGRVLNVGELYLNIARLLYEWNRLEEAQVYMQKASEFNLRSQFPPVLVLEFETAFWLHLAKGKTDLALEMLGKVDAMVSETHPNNRLYEQLFSSTAQRMRLQLAAQPVFSHMVSEVQQWVEKRGISPSDTFDYAHEQSYVVLADLLVLQDKAPKALPLLERLAQTAETQGRIGQRIGYLVKLALANQKLDRESIALNVFQQALELAEPQGYHRSFMDLGRPVQVLLEKLALLGNSYAQKLLTGLPQPLSPSQSPPQKLSPPLAPEELGGSIVPAELGPARTGPSLRPDVGLLNDREQTILRLMAGGNSNKQIGKVLEISPNTVKWYVRSLFEKLQVENRVEAISRARALGLV